MKRSVAVALAVLALGAGTGAASAQGSAQCGQFQPLSAATQLKANAVQAGLKAKVSREEMCKLLTAFVASESVVVKFLADNKTWCGVPDQVVANAKASHERSLKFRDTACAEGPRAKVPSLSDAIKTTPVDSATNTKTGRFGTFDSLTGNPLAK